MLSDHLEIHFVELPKLREASANIDQSLVRWLLFLTLKTLEGLEALAMNDPAIKQALTALEFLSQDEEARRLYRDRERALRAYRTNIRGAREEGREEGRKEGREEGRYEANRATAARLLELGMDVATIAQATGLTEEEILRIRGG